MGSKKGKKEKKHKHSKDRKRKHSDVEIASDEDEWVEKETPTHDRDDVEQSRQRPAYRPPPIRDDWMLKPPTNPFNVNNPTMGQEPPPPKPVSDNIGAGCVGTKSLLSMLEF